MWAGGWVKLRVPPTADLFYGKSWILLKIHDFWGYPYFRRPPYGFNQQNCGIVLILPTKNGDMNSYMEISVFLK